MLFSRWSTGNSGSEEGKGLAQDHRAPAQPNRSLSAASPPATGLRARGPASAGRRWDQGRVPEARALQTSGLAFAGMAFQVEELA